MELKICSYNLENLYIGLDRFNNHDLESLSELDYQGLSTSTLNKNKTLFKVLELADTIRKIDADIFCLQEVISKTSLLNLNKYFLENAYNVVLEESNSNRSIYVGFLIRKGIDYSTESYSKWKLSNGRLASRNLTSITVKKADQDILSLLGVHLKSKRPDENKTNTYDVRELEVELLFKIQNDIKQKYNCPIMILGDFNANFNTEPEFNRLSRCGYTDFVKIKHGDNYENVGTFATNYLETKVQHLDFILIEKKYHDRIDLGESDIHLYKNEYGDKITLPYNKIERQFLPSDHCPIFLTLKRNSKK
jgi:endonuclease/exonuclease/phosphatase family metal-dependent hydrolase